MRIDFSDIEKLKKWVDDKTTEKLLKFQKSILNDLAFTAKREIQQNMDRVFEINKPWVRNQIRVQKAIHDKNPYSEVFTTTDASFLVGQEKGETRKPISGSKYLYVRQPSVPETKTGVPARYLKRKDVFVTNAKVFQRVGSKLLKLFQFTKKKVISKHEFFKPGVESAINMFDNIVKNKVKRFFKW